jgi:hypothetical protein
VRSLRVRVRFSATIPTTQITTIPIAPTPRGPMLALAGSTALITVTPTTLITVTPTTAMTSSPSRAGTREAAAVDSGRSPRTKRSAITSTKVCMATPPIRFPAAIPRFPATAAEIVMASSGRLPATDSRIIPPSASPSP